MSERDNKTGRTCPICLCVTSVAQLCMGMEPGKDEQQSLTLMKDREPEVNVIVVSAFYVDCEMPDYCFVPCGHMASEKTVKYWSSVPIPCGTSGFQSACPFCAVPLSGTPGYVKLIFQAMSD